MSNTPNTFAIYIITETGAANKVREGLLRRDVPSACREVRSSMKGGGSVAVYDQWGKYRFTWTGK